MTRRRLNNVTLDHSIAFADVVQQPFGTSPSSAPVSAMRAIRASALIFTAVLSACELVGIGGEEEGPKYRLTATARSATTLQLQWDAMGSTQYTVDYLLNQTTCEFPTNHSNIQVVSGTSVTLTGLLPETLYQIHVHNVPALDASTNVILIWTLAAGVTTQAVLASDYTICD